MLCRGPDKLIMIQAECQLLYYSMCNHFGYHFFVVMSSMSVWRFQIAAHLSSISFILVCEKLLVVLLSLNSEYLPTYIFLLDLISVIFFLYG